MIFASKYENIPKRNDIDPYYELGLVNFKFTNRNWNGEKYIPHEDISGFINEVIEHDKLISPYLLSENLMRVSLLIDTSVFSHSPEENIKLLEFMEELSDFQDTELKSKELQKKRNKYLSKCRFYASKPENFGYLYRWAYVNREHPFSNELIDIIDGNMEQFKSSFEKKFDMSKVEELKGLSEEEFGRRYNSQEEESVGKLMKYSYSEPSLFFFNTYFVCTWFNQYNSRDAKLHSDYVITQYCNEKRILTDIYQGGSFHESCRIYQELMGDFMGLVSHDMNWRIANLTILEEIQEIDVHDEILHSIAKWVTNKIYHNRSYSLPNKSWYTEVTWDFLRDISFKEITFIREKELVGENGRELIVYAKVSGGSSNYIVFPLIDPKYWGNMNRTQKALVTYSLCLYHDITVENAFDFEDEQKSDENIPYNPFVQIPKKMKFEGVKVVSKTKSEGNRTPHKKHKPHKEHWVTFHFRKLKEGAEATEDAKRKASKYSIDIPSGFTFIDTHVRGGNIEGEAVLHKVSALDIFTKTIAKTLN